MAWNDTPPTKAELGDSVFDKPSTGKTTSWDSAPPTAEELNQPNTIQSFLRQAAATPTAGFDDELIGGVDAAGRILGIQKLGSAKHLNELGLTTPTLSMKDLMDAYHAGKNSVTADKKADFATNPKASFAGGLTGALIAPGMGALSEASPVVSGAALGAASGLGDSEADLTSGKLSELGKAAKDTVVGGAVGGTMGYALDKLSSLIDPEKLRSFGAKRAVKSTGIQKAQYKNLAKNGQVEEIGNRLLDEGVVTPFATGADILERSQDLTNKSGKEIQGILGSLDNAGVVQTMPNPTKVANEIESQLKAPLMNPQGFPYKTMSAQNNVVTNILEDITSHGNNPVTFEEAQAFKQMLKQAAYNGQGQVIDENAHKAYGIVNKWIEDAAHESAQASGQPGLLDKYINAKKNYNTGIQAQNAAANKEAQSAVNRDLGLTDYVSAAAGAAAHGTVGGITTMAANKAGKTYGNQFLATGARKASEIFKMPKQALQNFANSLSSQGETGQKLGQMIMQAAERDDVGKNALLFTLMQQPAYRHLLGSDQSNVGQ